MHIHTTQTFHKKKTTVYTLYHNNAHSMCSPSKTILYLEYFVKYICQNLMAYLVKNECDSNLSQNNLLIYTLDWISSIDVNWTFRFRIPKFIIYAVFALYRIIRAEQIKVTWKICLQICAKMTYNWDFVNYLFYCNFKKTSGRTIAGFKGSNNK